MADVESRLRRLYTLVENNEAEADDILSERITVLKAERARAKATLERAKGAGRVASSIGPDQVVEFGRHLRAVLSDADTPARKAWLMALINRVEVDETQIRVIGSTEVLHAAVAATSLGQNVRSSVPEWRTRHDSNV